MSSGSEKSGAHAAGDVDINSIMMMMDTESSHRGCCFFGSGSNCWERVRRGAGCGSGSVDDEGWSARGWRKIREWSELVAGPRWKTFIRRFGKRPAGNTAGQGKFGYDPFSYTLNFDDGQNGQFDEDSGPRDFSSRYAAIPASAKSSMDLGRDGPSFT